MHRLLPKHAYLSKDFADKEISEHTAVEEETPAKCDSARRGIFIQYIIYCKNILKLLFAFQRNADVSLGFGC